MSLSDTESTLFKLSFLAVLCLLSYTYEVLANIVGLDTYLHPIVPILQITIVAVIVSITYLRDKDGELKLKKYESCKPTSIICILTALAIISFVFYFTSSSAFVIYTGLFFTFVTVSDVYDDESKYWKYLWYFFLFIVLIGQAWINNEVVLLMSEANIDFDNKLINVYSPLLVSLGFGLVVASVIPFKGSNNVAGFIIASLVFFHGSLSRQHYYL